MNLPLDRSSSDTVPTGRGQDSFHQRQAGLWQEYIVLCDC
jgi:hypothetical protein